MGLYDHVSWFTDFLVASSLLWGQPATKWELVADQTSVGSVVQSVNWKPLRCDIHIQLCDATLLCELWQLVYEVTMGERLQ